jgi:hypothetical protein
MEIDKDDQPDREHINVNRHSELREWAKRLDVSEEEIKFAISAVGPLADDVRGFLAKY